MTKRKPVDPSKDLTGRRFGKLTVLGNASNGSFLSTRWRCVCDCGNEIVVMGRDLRAGDKKSCGCIYRNSRSLLFPGAKFGMLTIIEKYLDDPKIGDLWYTECECGNKTIKNGKRLLSGTISCGCMCHAHNSHPKHGKHGHPLYRRWSSMKTRCMNKNQPAYKNYGGRGISVCKEWVDSFEAFYEWAINNGFSENLSLDRIDVNGDYSPENCRWATPSEQSNNRRKNHIITVCAESLTIAQASEKYGVRPDTILARIRRGWSDEESVFGKAGR